MSLLELFVHVDDFWQAFAPQWEQELVASGLRRRRNKLLVFAWNRRQLYLRRFPAYPSQHTLGLYT